MPGPTMLPAIPKLELEPAQPFRLAGPAVVGASGASGNVYRLNPDFDSPKSIGNIAPGTDAIKSSAGK